MHYCLVFWPSVRVHSKHAGMARSSPYTACRRAASLEMGDWGRPWVLWCGAGGVLGVRMRTCVFWQGLLCALHSRFTTLLFMPFAAYIASDSRWAQGTFAGSVCPWGTTRRMGPKGPGVGERREAGLGGRERGRSPSSRSDFSQYHGV